MSNDIVALMLVLIIGIISLVFLFSSITGAYGSSKGYVYNYWRGNSGITGTPDFIVTTGLLSVPYCFNTPVEKGGFQLPGSPQLDWDYVSCYVVAPEDLFGSDRGNLPVHCFLNTPYYFPEGLPHPAICELKATSVRYPEDESGPIPHKGMPSLADADFIVHSAS